MLSYRKGLRRLGKGGYVSYHHFELEYPPDAPDAMARD